jgi:hypothetical protein
MSFTQGTLTDLKGIEAEFGPATEKERFDAPLWKTLGFDGLVCWWENVGVAISSDGAVTHVLVRTAPQSEEK